MPVVELALAVAATVDICFNYGKILIDQYATFQCADAEINERILCIKSNWKRTAMQLDFLQQVWKTLDEEHQYIQNQILRVLVSKLKTATIQVGRVQKKGQKNIGSDQKAVGMEKVKYVLLVKDCLDKAILDLEKWQKMFDPSWFLIMKVGSPLIDQELAKDDKREIASMCTAKELRDSLREEPQIKTSVFLPEDGLVSVKLHDIPFSTAQTMQRTSNKWFILDSVVCDPDANIKVLTKDVRDLATKLSRADALTFGLLNCHGVVKVTDPAQKKVTSFDFIFRIPEGAESPRSLRGILIAADAGLSLSDRFRVARQLAASVSYVHTYGFVHKSIRPETILVFQTPKSPLGASFLLGFERFRLADAWTLRLGDCVWEKDLYRHPRRQGLKPEEDYVMQHDIYSLGVCLLEIGLWESLVIYHDHGGSPSPSPVLSILKDLGTDEPKKPSLVKDFLVSLAEQRLPGRMGDKYTEIVMTCLTCLEENNPDFGDDSEFEDADGVLIGVRYIEKILLQLDGISI